MRAENYRLSRLTALVSAAVIGALVSPAQAAEGVIQINQGTALVGGVTPGDAPGYPVEINVSGSYRLVGNLDVPDAVIGISIQAGDVTLDLNGMTIRGAGTGVSAILTGVTGISAENITVRNGTVRDFRGRGIWLNGASNRVQNVRAIDNLHTGITLAGVPVGGAVVDCMVEGNGVGGISGGSVLISDNIVRNNTGNGIGVAGPALVRGNLITGNTDRGLFVLGDGGGYAGNVFFDNFGSGGTVPSVQVLGGIQLGSNLCDTALCP